MKSNYHTFFKSILSCMALVSFTPAQANTLLLLTPIDDYSYISKSLAISKVKQVGTNLMIINGKKLNSTKIEYIFYFF